MYIELLNGKLNLKI